NNDTAPEKGSMMVEDKEKPPRNDRTFTNGEREKAKEVHLAKEDLEDPKSEEFVLAFIVSAGRQERDAERWKTWSKCAWTGSQTRSWVASRRFYPCTTVAPHKTLF
ncbi:hypothetical protein ATANTOWER_010336, partial [Ataeniobius toweri]|nr:hypothetical protein [Ataeniobius toweri]